MDKYEPASRSEQAGKRPAVVLSPYSYNAKVDLALFSPVTNQIKGYPFEVIIPEGFKVTGAILSDQVKSLDWKERNAEFFDKIPESVALEILTKLTTLLRIDK